MHENFWKAADEDMKRGYCREGDFLTCLFCGKKYEQGVIYPEHGVFYDADKSMKRHIKTEHGSVFVALLSLDKRVTGLSAHQTGLLKGFYHQKSDAEIQRELGIGSPSTIRNHRFAFRERERQARVFLLLMRLLHDKNQTSGADAEECETPSESDEDIKGGEAMDRKKELKQMAREIKVQPGIYLVRNLKNGKVLVMSTPDLKTINGKKAQMAMGTFPNTLLQADLDIFGHEAFAFEILEIVEPKEDGYFNVHDELKRLEAKWVDHYKSYGDAGYNKR